MENTYLDGPLSCVDPVNIERLLEEARSVPALGCFVEFGVYKGGTAFHLAKIAREKSVPLYLYDTFNGIPNETEGKDVFRVGDFSDTNLDKVRALIPDAIFCAGVFPDSVVELPDAISFAHIDCDQYQAYKDAWRIFSPLMIKGGVMIFDDYPIIKGAKLAVDEVCGDRVKIELGKGVVRF
jgi:O-methyltransferase